MSELLEELRDLGFATDDLRELLVVPEEEDDE